MDATTEQEDQNIEATIRAQEASVTQEQNLKNDIMEKIRALEKVTGWTFNATAAEVDAMSVAELQSILNMETQRWTERVQLDKDLQTDIDTRRALFDALEIIIPKSEVDIYRVSWANMSTAELQRRMKGFGDQAVKDLRRRAVQIDKDEKLARSKLEFEAVAAAREDRARQERATQRIFEIAKHQARQAAGGKGVRSRRKRSGAFPALRELRAIISKRRTRKQKKKPTKKSRKSRKSATKVVCKKVPV